MSTPTRILITGRDGQVGHACSLFVPEDVEAVFVGRAECDLADPDAILRVLREVQPTMVLHNAAWTAVDAAEEQEAAALAINGTATAVMAEELARQGARMAFVSTDYVFSGEGTEPWLEQDAVAPLNAYGRTKLAGEQALAAHLGDRGHVVRTSWVYGRRGNNFVRTMLKFMQQGRDLKVVADQLGAPTFADGIAQALWALAKPGAAEMPPILHYTDGGICSWYEFAVGIRDQGIAQGLALEESSVAPCPSTEYPTPAARPSWSPLRFSEAWSEVDISQGIWSEVLSSAMPLLLAETIE
ncbi:MAG: dTDP-4-dehydrorhamnose reductase [Planctomycetota bacterium]